MYLPSDTLTASVVYLHHKLHAQLKMRPGSRSALAAPSQPALAPQFGCSVVQLRIRLGCSSFGDSALGIGEGSQAGCGGPGPPHSTRSSMRTHNGPRRARQHGLARGPRRPGNPQFRVPFPRFPIWPGNGEGTSDSRLFCQWKAYLRIENTLNGNRPS
jgi:hypothetical protein